MSRVSKYIKVDPNVLVEYIYSDENLIGEPYKVLVNTRDQKNSFMSGDLSGTKNTQNNQLFELDVVENRYGLVDTNNYNFLQVKDFAGGLPVRHDIIKFHFPINYAFQDKIGFYFKLYTLDFDNDEFYELSNYFFDITDTDRFNQLDFSSPQLQFQGELWGKNIEVSIPSVYALALQRKDGNAEAGTINSNLTNAVGLSQNSPIIIDFGFINKKDVINNITTYLVSSPKTVSFPQTPEFENLSVDIEESDQGDFFEIVGKFNDTAAGFNKFIEDSFTLGKRYYVEYAITMYEENIRGKQSTYIVTEDFEEPVEFRPIIKFSTTTAVIDVEMKLIDQVDNSQISRKASYGMLSDEVSKYSLSMSKIDVDGVSKPKIFNLKNTINSSGNLQGLTSRMGATRFEQVRVPFPVITDRNNIVAKSDSVRVNNNEFKGIGKLQIVIYPFDNVIKFIIARQIDNDSGKIDYFDLTNGSNISLNFKNDRNDVKSKLFTESNEVDLANGIVVFKIFNNQISKLRNIYNSGVNTFYITTQFDSTTTVIYSGTFVMFDSQSNITQLNQEAIDEASEEQTTPRIIQDPNLSSAREIATVTRRRIRNAARPVAPRQIRQSNLRNNLRNRLGNN